MKKAECIAVIKRYELARQLVSKLKKKRLELINNCSKTPSTSPDYFPEICLVTAYKDWQEMCTDNGELYPYNEILSEGVAEGKYCQNCMDAFNIKHNELSDAKAEFGKAKRSLSNFAKNLLKGY